MSLVSFRSENEEVGRVPGIDRDTGGVWRWGVEVARWAATPVGFCTNTHTCCTCKVHTSSAVIYIKRKKDRSSLLWDCVSFCFVKCIALVSITLVMKTSKADVVKIDNEL